MTQEQFKDEPSQRLEQALNASATHYGRLELPTDATTEQIRQAYRRKSKLYHPDTTALHPKIAAQKFNELNEAYAVLSNPERRTQYDLRLSAVTSRTVVKAASTNRTKAVAVGHLDSKERPLSPGEMFALFILGLTFAVCLVLALILGFARGEMILQTQASLPANSASQILSQTSFQAVSQTLASDLLQTRSGFPQKSAIIEREKALSDRFSPKDTAGRSLKQPTH